MRYAPLLLLVCLAGAKAEISGLGRSLKQAPAESPSGAASNLKVPSNAQIYALAQNATAYGDAILPRAGQLQLGDIRDIIVNGAYDTALQTLYAAAAGQTSSVLAGVSAVGADLLAAEGALTNNATVIAQAKTALAQVNSLISAIADVDTLQVSASEFADLALLANLAYESTQVLFYQNIPADSAANYTFSQEIQEIGYLLGVVEQQAANGASSSLLVLGAQAVAHYQLAAVDTFQKNGTGVSQQTIALAQIILKAVRVKQTSETCSASWDTVRPLVEAAQIQATNTTRTLSADDINSTVQKAQAVVDAAQCSSVATALAPAAQVASAGKK